MLYWLVVAVSSTCPANPMDQVLTAGFVIPNVTACSFTVTRCVFQKLKDTGIYLMERESSLFVTDTTFDSCYNSNVPRWDFTGWFSTTGKGGAINLGCKDVAVRRTCGYKCAACNVGQFAMFHIFGICELEDISLYLCGLPANVTTGTRNQDVMQAYLGDQRIVRLNSSSNAVLEDGAAFETTDSSALKILQCSFTASTGWGIMSMLLRDEFIQVNRERVLSMVNVYNNTLKVPSGKAELALINFLGPFTLSRWIFMGNTGHYCAREEWFGPSGGGYQPESWNYSMKYVDCVSDRQITGGSGAALQTVNVKVLAKDKIQSHTFFHWATKLCPGEPTFAFTASRTENESNIKIGVFVCGFMIYSSRV